MHTEKILNPELEKNVTEVIRGVKVQLAEFVQKKLNMSERPHHDEIGKHLNEAEGFPENAKVIGFVFTTQSKVSTCCYLLPLIKSAGDVAHHGANGGGCQGDDHQGGRGNQAAPSGHQRHEGRVLPLL